MNLKKYDLFIIIPIVLLIGLAFIDNPNLIYDIRNFKQPGFESQRVVTDTLKSRGSDNMNFVDQGGTVSFVLDLSTVAAAGQFLSHDGTSASWVSGLSSSTSSQPTFSITNTNADANGPSLILYKQSGSPADGDVLGNIVFRGREATLIQTDFAKIVASSSNVTNPNEDANLIFYNMVDGSLQETFSIKADGGSGQSHILFNTGQEDFNIKFSTSLEDTTFFIDGGTHNTGFGITPDANNRILVNGNMKLNDGGSTFNIANSSVTFDSSEWIFVYSSDTIAAIDTNGVLWLPADVSTPTARTNRVGIFVKTDNKPWAINEGSTEYDLTSTAGGGGSAYADSVQITAGTYDFDRWFVSGNLDTTNVVTANWTDFINNHFTLQDTFWMVATFDTVFADMDVSIGGIAQQDLKVVSVSAWTITSGTVAFNIKHRPLTTPGSGGVNVLSSNLTADSNTESSTTFNDATIDKDRHMRIVVASSGVTGDPDEFGVLMAFVLQ